MKQMIGDQPIFAARPRKSVISTRIEGHHLGEEGGGLIRKLIKLLAIYKENFNHYVE